MKALGRLQQVRLRLADSLEPKASQMRYLLKSCQLKIQPYF
jgi:hypothetical protein